MTDAHEFEAFVRRYQDMVFATAVRLLGNPAEAEDVAQTVFLKAFQRFDQIGSSPAVAGWLKTATRNACFNYLSRYRARWRFFSELGRADDSSPGRPGGPGVPGVNDVNEAADIHGMDNDAARRSERSPSFAMEQAELHERLEQGLRQLPDHQRVPLVLFHFEDMNYQEIARTMNISLGKVKTDIHRGRETLRRLLSTDHVPSRPR